MYMNLGRVCLVISTLAIGSASAAGDGEANLKTTIHAGAEAEAEPSDSAGGLGAVVAPIRDSLSGALDSALPRVTHGIGTLESLIGDAYYYGHWVSRDYGEAGRWYRRAAAAGNAMAASTLGDMYYYGRDVPQDYASAVMWWQTAADQGVAIAQLNLSVMYANGDGVEQDYVKSHMYANLAAAHLPVGEDREIAVKNRDVIAKTLTPAQIAEAQRLAREWRPKDTD
jgi:TPR repeat protein